MAPNKKGVRNVGQFLIINLIIIKFWITDMISEALSPFVFREKDLLQAVTLSGFLFADRLSEPERHRK